MNHTLHTCPVCSNPELIVTRLHCPECDTAYEGHFAPPSNPLAQLSGEQVQFVMAFIRNEGRFNRLEEELRLSYPTLRNRLGEIIRILGFEPEPAEPRAPALPPEERRRILQALENGELSFQQVQLQLLRTH
ncbi:MAG TPA: DUF2089 domain-containing protein [Anaerolineaceae bacterium]|nr:DUF2089 domain-containing protein [Anaerolineaceae bacterium]